MRTDKSLDTLPLQAYYAANGEEFLVEIEADNSDEIWHRYQLKKTTGESFSILGCKLCLKYDINWRLTLECGDIIP